MTHLPHIMSTVRTAAEHIGGALYDLGVNDRDSALRRLYRAKAALEDAIGRVQVEKYGDFGNRPHGGLQ
jgi:hypothetical protein